MRRCAFAWLEYSSDRLAVRHHTTSRHAQYDVDWHAPRQGNTRTRDNARMGTGGDQGTSSPACVGTCSASFGSRAHLAGPAGEALACRLACHKLRTASTGATTVSVRLRPTLSRQSSTFAEAPRRPNYPALRARERLIENGSGAHRTNAKSSGDGSAAAFEPGSFGGRNVYTRRDRLIFSVASGALRTSGLESAGLGPAE
jgi:hypothetical protein